MSHDTTQPPGTPAVGDLFRLADRDPVVRHFLHAWRAGMFPTFEQCLVALAVELARRNERLSAEVLRSLR